MIPEKEREALMRLTMCAREECIMCKYHKECDFDFQYETATRCMNILADALRKDEPTISKMEQVDEPQKDCKKCKNYDRCKNNRWKCCVYEPKEEPQKWETPPKFEHKGDITTCVSVPVFLIKDALVEDEPQTDCAWK